MNTAYDDQFQDPPGDDVLAAEYVLGLLDADARNAAMQRVSTDAQFAEDVAAWGRHFSPWLETIAPMAVPDHIWPRIQQSVGQLSPMRAGRPVASTTSSSWWGSVGVWRWLSAGGFAAAAASLFALMVNVQHPQSAPTPPIATLPPPVPVQAVPDMIATIAADDGSTAFMANIDSEHGKIMMVPVAANIPAGKVPELWLIPPGGAPQSLGLVDPTRAHSVDIPDAMRNAFGPDALVAISLEPPGGSPTGQPTGPVIAKGGIARI